MYVYIFYVLYFYRGYCRPPSDVLFDSFAFYTELLASRDVKLNRVYGVWVGVVRVRGDRAERVLDFSRLPCDTIL